MQRGRVVLRVLFALVALVSTTLSHPAAYASRQALYDLNGIMLRATTTQNARVVLTDAPNDIIPQESNKWNCSCDTDGCWPGCFTVASAVVLKYWAQRGYSNLWYGDENGLLIRLRELFPNMACDGNGDGNGKPGDTIYDAFDVADGLRLYAQEKNLSFFMNAIPYPTFDQIVAEIDAGRPVIGAFGESPWGSHAGTIIGYDTTGGRQVLVVRPNLWHKLDTDLQWGEGYRGLAIVTVVPGDGAAAQALAAPQVTYEVLVNDADPGFSAQGNWVKTDGLGHGGEARAHKTTDPTNLGPTDDTGWARWNPQLPFDGVWEVLAWMPVNDAEDSATHNAIYRITHAEGMHMARRSQHDATQGWMSLGSYPFVRGDKGSVYVGNLTGDVPLRSVWADVVKFVWRAPLIVMNEQAPEELYLVQHGKRLRIPDDDTFDALRLNRSNIRKLTPLEISQYAPGNMLPSIYMGWVGQYFNNTVLAAPASVVRGDSSLNFNWNGAAPAANMSSLGFSARWTRNMVFTEGNYPFSVDAVGSVRLYVDGKLEINAWDSSGVYVQHQQVVSMTSGLHKIEVEYANREGSARVMLGNLPPNVPIVFGSDAQWTTSPTVTVSWSDGGDADSAGKPHRYYVSAWRESDGLMINSDWISETQWTVALPSDGRYLWRVSASDGTGVSDWSQPQTIWVDHSPPWAQMLAAEGFIQPSSAEQPIETAAEQPQGAVITETLPEGDLPLVGDLPAAPVRVPGVLLTWWMTDTVSGAASVDVQARELVHSSVIYTPSVEMHEVTRVSYELVISGTQPITNAIVTTVTLPYTTVAPLRIYTPVPDGEWITVATGVAATQTLFVGNPGSTYEFRVRSRDHAGNEQDWYEGYAVQAQMDPELTIVKTYIPLVLR